MVETREELIKRFHFDTTPGSVTRAYIDAGYHISEYGEMFNTKIKPGYYVQVVGCADHGSRYVVEKITYNDYAYSADRYYRAGRSNTLCKPTFHLKGRSKPLSAKSIIPVSGATNMLQIESKKSTLVIETKEVIDTDNTVKVIETGSFTVFESLGQAQTWITKTIRDSVRDKNEYRTFRIYQVVSEAKASEPPVTFS